MREQTTRSPSLALGPTRWGVGPIMLFALAVGGVFAGIALSWNPLAAMAVVVGPIGFAFILRRPEIGLYLTVIAIPLEKFGRFTENSAVQIVSLAKIVGLVTLVAWVVRSLIRRETIRIPAPFAFLVAFWLIGAMTLLHTTAPEMGAARLMSFLATFLFYLLVVNLVDRPEVLRRTLECLLLATLVMGAFAIAQRYMPQFAVQVEDDVNLDAAGVIIDASESETLGGVVARSGGAAGSPHVYAANLLVALPLYIALARTAGGPVSQIWLTLGGIVALANLLLTQTRAALIVLVIAGGLLVLKRIVVLNLRAVLISMVAVIAVLPFLPATVYDRLLSARHYTTEGSATLQTRLDYWASGLEMLEEYWLTGMGIGNFTILPNYNEVATPGFGFMHNIYLQMLNEVGIFGFAALLGFLWLSWRAYGRAERALRQAGFDAEALMMAALGVSFLSILILGFTIDFLHFAVKDWWLVAALGAATVTTVAGRSNPGRPR